MKEKNLYDNEPFLSFYLGPIISSKEDHRLQNNKTESVLFDSLFDEIDKIYNKGEILEFEKELNLPYSTFEHILKWFNKKHSESKGTHSAEYTDFVKKVIYPALLKVVPTNVNKLKLMFVANSIANDAMFRNTFEGKNGTNKNYNQINKYTVSKTFIDPKITGIKNELNKHDEIKNLIHDHGYLSSIGEGEINNNAFVKLNYKPKSKTIQNYINSFSKLEKPKKENLEQQDINEILELIDKVKNTKINKKIDTDIINKQIEKIESIKPKKKKKPKKERFLIEDDEFGDNVYPPQIRNLLYNFTPTLFIDDKNEKYNKLLDKIYEKYPKLTYEEAYKIELQEKKEKDKQKEIENLKKAKKLNQSFKMREYYFNLLKQQSFNKYQQLKEKQKKNSPILSDDEINKGVSLLFELKNRKHLMPDETLEWADKYYLVFNPAGYQYKPETIYKKVRKDYDTIQKDFFSLLTDIQLKKEDQEDIKKVPVNIKDVQELIKQVQNTKINKKINTNIINKKIEEIEQIKPKEKKENKPKKEKTVYDPKKIDANKQLISDYTFNEKMSDRFLTDGAKELFKLQKNKKNDDDDVSQFSIIYLQKEPSPKELEQLREVFKIK